MIHVQLCIGCIRSALAYAPCNASMDVIPCHTAFSFINPSQPAKSVARSMSSWQEPEDNVCRQNICKHRGLASAWPWHHPAVCGDKQMGWSLQKKELLQYHAYHSGGIRQQILSL